MKNKIFLDMDGVLVDFFGQTVRLCKKKKIKDLTPDDIFNLMSSQDSIEKYFAQLPEFKSNNVLLNKIKKLNGGHYYICSSPLQDDREDANSERNRFFIQQSIFGKHAWVKNHLEPQPIKMCFSRDKWKDAPAVEKDGTRNILIDDRQENVDAWNKAGGIAIKFQADEHVGDPNLEYLDKQLEKVVKQLKKDKSSYNEVVESYLNKYKGN
jgi:hypothetical protein